MQVKVNTGEKVYRFNQKGQLIDTITEPYVSVDTRTREDLEALYDSLHEHIATAFTYEGNCITGLAAEYVNTGADHFAHSLCYADIGLSLAPISSGGENIGKVT